MSKLIKSLVAGSAILGTVFANTQNVTGMSGPSHKMYSGGFNVTNMTGMSHSFKESKASERKVMTQHLSGHANEGGCNTSSVLANRSNDVTDADHMFANSEGIQDIDFSSCDTHDVIDTRAMFSPNCLQSPVTSNTQIRPTVMSQTSLHDAVLRKDKNAVEHSLSKIDDINAKDKKYGRTALHYAAENNSKEIGELLISKGADINAKDKAGRTPLHYAAEKNRKEIGEILISKGADINTNPNFG